jgi:hypothetical protein
MLTMDHTRATTTGAAERYALGELDDLERDEFEEHFFGCVECADEVKAAVRFLDAAQPLLGHDERVDLPEAGRSARRAPASIAAWPRVRSLFWPMPLAAAATLVLVLGGTAAYLATVKVPRLEAQLADAESLQSVPWHFLSVSRSETPKIEVVAGEHAIGLSLSRSSGRSFPFYLCELRDAEGHKLLSRVVPETPGRDELQLLVPTRNLPSGAYAIAVAGLESATSRTPASEFTRYHFTFARQGEASQSQ